MLSLQIVMIVYSIAIHRAPFSEPACIQLLRPMVNGRLIRSSAVSSFEIVKEIYDGKKIIVLSENGSIPHPDSLVSNEAGWSYFMPWYGDYTIDGWAHDNTADDWNSLHKS